MTSAESPVIERVLPCIACGYDLRGSVLDGHCPECGEPVVRSLVASQGVTKRELVVIALRLFAVWSALQVISYLNYVVVALYEQGANRNAWVHAAFGTIAAITIAMVTWFASGPLSVLIVKRDSTAGLSRAWSFDGLFALGVALLGLWSLTTGVTQLPLIWRYADPQYGEFFAHQFWNCIGRITVGVLLLVGVRPLTSLVVWLRQAGTRARA